MRARGTGTLVGPNLLLTASHVVPWEGDPWWLKFVPGFRDDTEPFGSSFCSEFTGYSPRDDPFGYD
jgi:V8-like Glu-specific endopeptidase